MQQETIDTLENLLDRVYRKDIPTKELEVILFTLIEELKDRV